MLNAKPENVERESEIVAQSGRKGAVTISTNMAGRGALLSCCPDQQQFVRYRGLLVVSMHGVDDCTCPPSRHPTPCPPCSSGTDILLGGNPGYMARLKLQELLFPEIVSQGEVWACWAWCREAGSVCRLEDLNLLTTNIIVTLPSCTLWCSLVKLRWISI